MKETWPRLRCESIGREGKLGYKNMKCRMREKINETSESIRKFGEAKVEIKRGLIKGIEKWRKETTADKLSCTCKEYIRPEYQTYRPVHTRSRGINIILIPLILRNATPIR